MLLLPGSVALSAPRFSRLSAQITELDPTLRLKRAFFVYAVDTSDAVDEDKLSALLQPGTSAEPVGDELYQQELVVVAEAGEHRQEDPPAAEPAPRRS